MRVVHAKKNYKRRHTTARSDGRDKLHSGANTDVDKAASLYANYSRIRVELKRLSTWANSDDARILLPRHSAYLAHP